MSILSCPFFSSKNLSALNGHMIVELVVWSGAVCVPSVSESVSVCVWVWLCVSLCHQSVSEGFGKPEDRLWLIAWLNWITYYPVPMLKKIGSEKPPLLWKSHTGNGWKSGVKNHQGNQENHYTAASNCINGTLAKVNSSKVRSFASKTCSLKRSSFARSLVRRV